MQFLMSVPLNKYLHDLREQIRSRIPLKIVLLSIGNPGKQFKGTRHNVGHDVADAVSTRLGGLDHEINLGSATLAPLKNYPNIYFARSLVYMNVSGLAARAVQNKFSKNTANVTWIVVHDDLSLDVPEVKFKLPSTSVGGHNGLKDLAWLGPFARLRIGIDAPSAMDSMTVSNHVLGRFTNVEKKRLEQCYDAATAIVHRLAEASTPRPATKR